MLKIRFHGYYHRMCNFFWPFFLSSSLSDVTSRVGKTAKTSLSIIHKGLHSVWKSLKNVSILTCYKMHLISFQMYFNLHAKIAIHILAQKFNDLRIFLARFARYVVKLDFLGFFFQIVWYPELWITFAIWFSICYFSIMVKNFVCSTLWFWVVMYIPLSSSVWDLKVESST